MVRHREGRPDRGCANVLGGPGRQSNIRQQEQGVYPFGGSHIGPDRNQVQREYRSLDLRHVDARQWHRESAGQTRRSHLFLLTADYAFGHALERDTTAAVEASGGKVIGKVRHPLNANDFSSFLLQAQASKAKVIGLANAGGDTINAIKAGSEFGLTRAGQKFAGLLVTIGDVGALGLETVHGLTLTESWYWDANDTTRDWTKRWQQERPGKFPTMGQAGVYSGVLHYLKAVAALKSSADGKAVVAKMKEMPTEDPIFGKGTIRLDGRKLHDAYLFEVKNLAESKYPGDFYHLRATIPAAEAFRPLKDGGCLLVSR